MTTLLLVFTASLMASVHCAAMCGGFALSLVQPGRVGASLVRTGLYHAGKLFTYLFIGTVAGMAGAALLNNPALRSLQVVFSALAGAMIVVVGLQTLGLIPGENLVNRIASRLWLGPFLGPIFRTFRDKKSLDGAFFLGLFNGFLPCGLVYTFALSAAGTGNLGAALLTMAAFGLGTVPMLAAVGLAGLAFSTAFRPVLARASGLLVIALGLVTAMRGTPLLTTFAAGSGGHTGHAVSNHASAMEAGIIDLEPSPAPDFSLTDQAGRRVSLHDYHGQVIVMDFIYTSCTTTCPLLAGAFKVVQSELGADFGKKVALVSITVDPATDTPPVLKAFGEKWGADFSGWSFLTGSPAEIQQVTQDYAVYVERAADGLAHTETILLIDPHGQLRAALNLNTDPQMIAERALQLAH